MYHQFQKTLIVWKLCGTNLQLPNYRGIVLSNESKVEAEIINNKNKKGDCHERTAK